MEVRTALFLMVGLLSACSEYKLESSLDADDISAVDEPDEDPIPDTGTPPEEDDPDYDSGIKGRVCDPSGDGWVVGAYVYAVVDEDGDGTEDWRAEDTTDEEGRFHLTGLPPDEHYTVVAEKGSFRGTFEVDLGEGLYEIPEEECMLDPPAIAVVTGDYDHIEGILDGIGLDYDLYEGTMGSTEYITFLTDETAMAAYDIIFLNCGTSEDWMYTDAAGIAASLRTYVENGGSLYASDWAYYFIEETFAGKVDFYGDDTAYTSAQVGMSGPILAQVNDPTMQAILGASSADINFDLDMWVVAESVGGDTEVLLQANVSIYDFWTGSFLTVTNSPIAVRFRAGPASGRVIYTAFHNEHAATTPDMRELLEEIILSL